MRHLPHQLIEAFRSTLEEVADADLVIHVVDGSDPDPWSQLRAVREVFADVGARDVPELVVINKADLADPEIVTRLLRDEPGACVVSAATGTGLDELRTRVAERLPHPDVPVRLLIPYDHGEVVSRIHRYGEIDSLEHSEQGTCIRGRLPGWLAGEVSAYAQV